MSAELLLPTMPRWFRSPKVTCRQHQSYGKRWQNDDTSRSIPLVSECEAHERRASFADDAEVVSITKGELQLLRSRKDTS
jgi:hypothetical protein